MTTHEPFWKTPAWGAPVDRVNRVELLELFEDILPEDGWPERFWRYVHERRLLVGAEAEHVVRLFRELEPGESARCHMPPWGLALYEDDDLLMTVTLCFRCHNAYVYTAAGKDLRAFDSTAPKATALRELLKRHLPKGSE